MLVTCPFLSNLAGSSPKYHTLRLVLAVPVRRAFEQSAATIEAIQHHNARDAGDSDLLG